MRPALFAIAALFGAVIGAAGMLYLAPSPAPDTLALRAAIEEVLAERDAATPAPEPPPPVALSLDPEVLNPMIETYLMDDPAILERMAAVLDTRLRAAEREETAAALATAAEALYETEGHVVLGNPEGDVTLVELFDYNCVYCRQALPDVATLLAEDPDLRVILKEFPILSEGSVEAARISVLVAETDADFWAFHQALFSARGQVDKDTALSAATDIGLSRVALELDMNTERVERVIQTSYDLARTLNISGTPTFIIGDEIIPGAIGLEELRGRIANMRDCGSTFCE